MDVERRLIIMRRIAGAVRFVEECRKGNRCTYPYRRIPVGDRLLIILQQRIL